MGRCRRADTPMRGRTSGHKRERTLSPQHPAPSRFTTRSEGEITRGTRSPSAPPPDAHVAVRPGHGRGRTGSRDRIAAPPRRQPRGTAVRLGRAAARLADRTDLPDGASAPPPDRHRSGTPPRAPAQVRAHTGTHTGTDMGSGTGTGTRTGSGTGTRTHYGFSNGGARIDAGLDTAPDDERRTLLPTEDGAPAPLSPALAPVLLPHGCIVCACLRCRASRATLQRRGRGGHPRGAGRGGDRATAGARGLHSMTHSRPPRISLERLSNGRPRTRV